MLSVCYTCKVVDMTNDYKTNTVYSALSGSLLYGTNSDQSDVDTRSVYIGTVYQSPSAPKAIWDEDTDSAWVELREFVHRLVIGSNTELETLFSDKVLVTSKYIEPILEIRDVFLSAAWLKKVLAYSKRVMLDMDKTKIWQPDLCKNVAHVLRILDTVEHYRMTGAYTPAYHTFCSPWHLRLVKRLKRVENLATYDFTYIYNHLDDTKAKLERHVEAMPPVDMDKVNSALYASLTTFWSEMYVRPNKS